jgi:hypothetical protein
MGMYNEVFKTCPECAHISVMQIPQIVLGFGGFNLDAPDSIAEELSPEEVDQLINYVKDRHRYFECPECHNTFQLKDTAEKSASVAKLKNLLGST